MSRQKKDRRLFLSRFRHPLAYFMQWIAMLCMLLQPVPLSFADSGVSSGTDSDGDGLPDVWEAAYGLNPNDPTDAFKDMDGDRVPNLWEYQAGTSPVDATSAPLPELVVDGSQATDATQSRYATLQEAYDASPEFEADGVTPHFGYIEVKPWVYTTGVDGSQAPKKLLWLADSGGQVIIQSSGLGVFITDEAVLDSFTFLNGGGGAAIVTQPFQSGALSEVHVVNCIIAGCDGTNNATWQSAGGVVNNGANLWLVQDTLVGNHGGSADAIYNQAGTIQLVNSVVGWQVPGTSNPAVSDSASGLTATNSIITDMGGVFGSWADDPMLTQLGGHLTALSTACFGRGAAGSGVMVDMYDQPLSTTAPDLGAEQWVSTTGTGLPDWYAQRMVAANMIGSIGQLVGTSSYSGNGLSALQEYQLGVLPGGAPLTSNYGDNYNLYAQAGSAAVLPGKTSTISVNLTNATRGTPVVGATVAFNIISGDGQVNSTTSATAVTDTSGNCSVTFTGGYYSSDTQIGIQDLSGLCELLSSG